MADYFVNINSRFKSLQTKKKVLVVGLTCIDIVNVCKDFPQQDQDVNVLSQIWSVGGNAANTARVLSQHSDVEVHLFSSLSTKSENSFVLNDLKSHGVNIEKCSFHDDVTFPTSCCIINSCNGTRTILHYNHKFPTLDYSKFVEIDTNYFDLIHFEGRDLESVSKMIDYAIESRGTSNFPIITAEMEKPKRLVQLETYLKGKTDILFISKDIGKAKGFDNAQDTLKYYSDNSFNSNCMVCPWGEMGAGLSVKKQGEWEFSHLPAFHLEKPVDTLGAGDVFIGGFIYGIISCNKPKDSVQYGCFLAKEKCAQIGLQDLVKRIKQLQ